MESLLTQLGSVASAVITQVGAICGVIVAQPLLLLTVGFLFIGGAIGIFGRLLSLDLFIWRFLWIFLSSWLNF